VNPKPDLNFPALDLPTCTEVRVFRAFERVLRTDPILSSLSITWITWRGSSDDLWTPEFNLCPFVRIAPANMSYAPITEKQHITPMSIQLLIATAGTNIDEIGNLYGAVRNALFPQNNPTLRDRVSSTLDAAGATRPVLRMGSFTLSAETDRAPLLIGIGSIDFNVLIDT
jgi:hypothetical protein